VLHGKPQALTSAAFVGSHTVSVTLTPGRWTVLAAGKRKATFFVTS